MTDPSHAPSAASTEPVERGEDRRLQPTARLSRFSIAGGKRHEVRRQGEREGTFVDLYGPRLWLVVFWIAGLNVADSYFTLVHLQAGGVELNPIAALLLATGRGSFVLVKSGLIALALIVLCLHKNFLLARIGLLTAAATYTLLVLYHLALFRVA